MISSKDGAQCVNGKIIYPARFCGLSTDTKPSGFANGSEFEEIDTGKVYTYDYTGDEWYEVAQSGGGGGEPTESDLFTVTVTLEEDADDNLVATADKTLAETLEASGAGRRILIRVSDETGESPELQDVYPSIASESMLWHVSYIARSSGENGALCVYDFEWTEESEVETISVDFFTFDADSHGW